MFPAEAWELITKNRDGDDLVIIDLSAPPRGGKASTKGYIKMLNGSVNMIKKRVGKLGQATRFLVDLALIPIRILLLDDYWSIFPRDPSLNLHSSSARFSRSDGLQPGLRSLWDFHL